MASDEIQPANPEFWRDRWVAERTGWDLGGPHPFLRSVFADLQNQSLLAAGAAVWVPGCGRAHCAAALAEDGFTVFGSDVVEEAIAAASQLYEQRPRLTLGTGNALTPLAEPVDAIFDRAVLCAIGPDQRQEYAKSMANSLKDGGLFVTFAFTETNPSHGQPGPPFGIPFDELTEMLSPWMSLVSAEEKSGAEIYPEEYAGPIVSEVLAVFRKRGNVA